jgi:YHS domain-containing protein
MTTGQCVRSTFHFSAAVNPMSKFVSASKRLIFSAIIASVVGCSAMQAQNPGDGYGPVNAVPSESGDRLMLKGHDVVNYFTQSKHALGSPQIKSVYKGVTFQFASEGNKKLFDASPEKYLPEYGGYCANGIVYGIPWGGDADTWVMVDGKLYIFGGAGSRDAFMLDVPNNRLLAEKYWKDEVMGSNSFIQRGKRLTFKVPHYKSGEQLAEMVAKGKPSGGSQGKAQ